MAWNGMITFGYNGDGYGDYTDGLSVDITSNNTSTMDETLSLLREVATEYCKAEVSKGWEMSYDWNWGDVFNEIPNDVLAAHGITTNACGTQIVPHDELVVPWLASDDGEVVEF